MLPISLGDNGDGLRVLMLGAHCDDIEIGCGGTIMRLARENKVRQVKWLVFTSTPVRSAEAMKSANYFLEKVEMKEVVTKGLRDGFLPFSGAEVKELVEELKSFQPDIIFTHARHDLHQDHRLIGELTWNTFRDHLILEYEIPKYDGDLGRPNFFVTLPETIVERKVDAIMNYYPSQAGKQWFDKETFTSLMRIRGLECGSRTRYAEGFYLSKAVAG